MWDQKEDALVYATAPSYQHQTIRRLIMNNFIVPKGVDYRTVLICIGVGLAMIGGLALIMFSASKLFGG
jgi:hypothetical protein